MSSMICFTAVDDKGWVLCHGTYDGEWVFDRGREGWVNRQPIKLAPTEDGGRAIAVVVKFPGTRVARVPMWRALTLDPGDALHFAPGEFPLPADPAG